MTIGAGINGTGLPGPVKALAPPGSSISSNKDGQTLLKLQYGLGTQFTVTPDSGHIRTGMRPDVVHRRPLDKEAPIKQITKNIKAAAQPDAGDTKNALAQQESYERYLVEEDGNARA